MSKKAELLYRAQLAANNLTITPSNGPLKFSTNGNQSHTPPPAIRDTHNSPMKSQPPKPNAMTTSPSANAAAAANFRRPRQIFSPQQEEQLAVYVRDTANYYSGLSSKEVRILAFVYAVCNQVEMPSGWHESHQASFDWCVGFIKRNKLAALVISSNLSNKTNCNSTSNPMASMKSPKATSPNSKTITEQSNDNCEATPIEIDD